MGTWSGLVCFEAGYKMLLSGLHVIVLALWLQELQGVHFLLGSTLLTLGYKRSKSLGLWRCGAGMQLWPVPWEMRALKMGEIPDAVIEVGGGSSSACH